MVNSSIFLAKTEQRFLASLAKFWMHLANPVLANILSFLDPMAKAFLANLGSSSELMENHFPIGYPDGVKTLGGGFGATERHSSG